MSGRDDNPDFQSPQLVDEHTVKLLARARVSSRDDTHRFHEQAFHLNRPLALQLARRYYRHGADSSDLDQVALLGMWQAVRRFNPRVGRGFRAFATPTVTGELRRYFRDATWTIRPPRATQELAQTSRRAIPDLEQRLRRHPSTGDLAQALGVEESRVRAAREAESSYHPDSLSAPRGEATLEAFLADPSNPLTEVETHHVLRQVIPRLPERDRTILLLRFWEDLSQKDIGAALGISQMQVSRLLAASLQRLRDMLADPGPPSRPQLHRSS